MRRGLTTGNPIYFAGGLFASLWTPETYAQTAISLASAPLAAARIASAGTKSAAAAARAAMKEVVEEVVGVPLPTKPKFHSRSGGQILEGATWDNIAISPKTATKSDDVTVPYQKVDAAENHLKYGITKNPASRYTQEELAGGRIKTIAQGPRKEMLKLERELHSTLPRG